MIYIIKKYFIVLFTYHNTNMGNNNESTLFGKTDNK